MMNEWIKLSLEHTDKDTHLYVIHEKSNPDIYDNMHEPWRHYAKSIKTERQTLYDFTCEI